MFIGLNRRSTLTQVTSEVVELGQFLPATLPLLIVDDMMIEVGIGHRIPATIPLVIRKQRLMFKGEVGIGLQPATIPPITKGNMVDCWNFREKLLVVMSKLDIGLRPATLLHKEEIVGVTVQDTQVGRKI